MKNFLTQIKLERKNQKLLLKSQTIENKTLVKIFQLYRNLKKEIDALYKKYNQNKGLYIEEVSNIIDFI